MAKEKAAVAVKPVKKKSSGEWFVRIAKIATEIGESQYSDDDVRTILKAWRLEYTERKKAQKAKAKVAKAAAAGEEEEEEETE